MRFYPSSYGTARSATKVREFNKCHDAKTGQFGAKGDGDCASGEWNDKGRQRAIYGQEVDDAEALNLDEDEATEASSFLEEDLPEGVGDGDVEDNTTQQKVKQQICGTMGPELEKLPGFNNFYRSYSEEIDGSPGNGADGSEGGYDWSNDPLELKSQYEDDWRSYRDGVMEAADQRFAHEQHEEWVEDNQRAVGAVAERIADVREIWEEVKAESPYGDVSDHPVLPGLEDVTPGGKTLEGDLNTAAFLQRAILDPKKIPGSTTQPYDRTYSKMDGHEWQREMDKLDLTDPEMRERVKDEMRKYTYIAAFDEDQPDAAVARALLTRTSYYFRDPDLHPNGDDGEDNWRDAQGGEPEYDYDNFEDWYVSAHGEPDNVRNVGRGARAASFIVHKWAQTSGDGDTVAVMMQEAANREFKLGATYAGVFARRGSDILGVEDGLKQHGAFLQGALRTMYDQTQSALKGAGIEYVTLYRGFGIDNTPQPNPNISILKPYLKPGPSREPGFETVNQSGDFVDVLLQPMSSFSSNYDTARNFAGYNNPTLMGTRVHRSKIIGTARSGYGCLNEYEYVVLGGRQPAFIVSKDAQGHYGGSYSSFWRSFKETQRRRAKPSPVVPGPGDRL